MTLLFLPAAVSTHEKFRRGVLLRWKYTEKKRDTQKRKEYTYTHTHTSIFSDLPEVVAPMDLSFNAQYFVPLEKKVIANKIQATKTTERIY